MHLDGILSGLIQALAAQNSEALLWALAIFSIAVLLRRFVASFFLWALSLICNGFGIKLERNMRTVLQPAGQAIVVSVAALISLSFLVLPADLESTLLRIIDSVLVASVFSAIYELVVPFGLIIFPTGSRSRVTIGREWIEKIGQIAIVALGVASVLDIWGIKIGSALTGLGVFGAAMAFATQDFIRNLVAGMTNTSERRFKIGDWILMANGDEGIVERIELRSTLVRRFDQGAAFIPNSDLANATVVNFNSRLHRQIYWEVPLQQDTSSEQLRQVRNEIDDFVRSCPDFLNTDDFPVQVRISSISSESMTILIYIYTKTPAYSEFLAVQERLVLAVVEAVEKAGANFAYRGGTLFFDRNAPTSKP